MSLWFGWLRQKKGAPWERVCEADTLAACHRKLGAIARLKNIKDRDTCTTTGAVPRLDADTPAIPTPTKGKRS